MNEIYSKGVLRIPHSYVRVFFLTIAVYLSYSPFTIATSGDGLSANYFFVLIPIYYLFKEMRLVLPHKDLMLVMLSFGLLFTVASILQAEYWEIFYRKLSSFLLFFTAFLFAFIRVDKKMILAFKIGTALFTLFLSFDNLFEYRSFDVEELGYAAKNQVGNQRFGFMYVFVFWLVLFYKSHNHLIQLAKIPALILLFTGIFLTFSRSSVVSFALSFVVLCFHYFQSRNLFNLRFFMMLMVYAIVIFLMVFLTGYYEYLFIPFQFFGERFNELISGEGINLANMYTSEGYRLYLLREIIFYVSTSPIYGSGFLGIWILFEDQVGSAHGQFNDILFRTGFVGLFIYFYLLLKILKFLKANDFGMYIGFWGILAFGLFHETFKLGHGAFILAFIIGMWASSVREQIEQKKLS